MRRLFIAACAALFACATAASADAAPVRVDGGLVQGAQEDGMAVFKGVPFAAAPVGPLRWRAPQPAPPWQGVKSTTQFAPACMQVSRANAVLGIPAVPVSEDCLYLNIWSPAKAPSERLPVMVWIYGGGFTQGATSFPAYTGEQLARHGVILVSVAYRLGPFGFLATPELTAESHGGGAGNYGLQDQIAALKWIQHNIAAFGGDPRKVTIFGESAGGIAVSMLAASPEAKGLFQGAISESGGSFAPDKQGDAAGEQVLPLAADEEKGAAFLARLGAHDLASARALPADAINQAAGPALAGFWPTDDGVTLKGDQVKLYREGRFNDTPVLIGTNADEGALFVGQTTAAQYVAGVRSGYGAYADKVLAAYPAGSDAEALRSARDLMRDSTFAWSTWTWARLQSQKGHGKAFVYYFNHRPPYPDLPAMKDWGASHGSEIAYVFGHMDPKATPSDQAMAESLMSYWTNFAKTGDPNGPGQPAWPAFTDASEASMHLNATPQAGPLPNLDKLKVLDGYFAWRRGEAGP